MRNSGKALRRQQSDFEVLQGGTLPENVVRRHFAGLKKTQTEKIEKKLAIRQQAAKYFSQIRPSGATKEKAIRGLRTMTDRLAKQKLAQPREAIVPPYGLWGSYTLRFTPPYSGLGTYSGRANQLHGRYSNDLGVRGRCPWTTELQRRDRLRQCSC